MTKEIMDIVVWVAGGIFLLGIGLAIVGFLHFTIHKTLREMKKENGNSTSNNS